MLTIDNLKQILQPQTNCKKLLVAYSGGLDSHVLLHALSQCKDLSITAIHVNHQLNPNANNWVEHCQQVCDVLNIPLHVEKINIDLKPGDSLEEKAREARYAAFKKYLDKNTVLLTAHHLDDQAETFLLQALRGSGLKGLSAMPVKKCFADNFHIRPLLSYSRCDLEQYANINDLKWIDDDSNVDTRFDRNFLRHEIFPLLKKRFPAVMQSFSRSARLMAEAESVIEDDIKVLYSEVETSDAKINLYQLKKFSDAKQRLVLRHWFYNNQIKMPSEKQLLQIQKDVLCARDDADPIFDLGNVTLRRFQNFLYLVKPEKFKMNLPDNVRTRKPGDRIKLPGQKKSKSLKNYFQEQGVPPWERDHVLFVEGEDGYLKLC